MERPALRQDPAAEPILSAHDLGFDGDAERGWCKATPAGPWTFRPLRRLAALEPVEELQREVMGVAETDVIPASELVVVAETGGEVIGAFPPDADRPAGRPAGVLIGWGGFVAGRPRIVSDLLAVRADFRNAGIGADLKRLQAVHALGRGFVEIVWTVDPLRAANARLNFEKLGATASAYEIDRYGTGFGAGLYGNLPTDRLHVRWAIASARVRDRLLGRARLTTAEEVAALPAFAPGIADDGALVPLPVDVDRLLATDPERVRAWRFALREQLSAAFAEGWAITGFVKDAGTEGSVAAYVLTRPTEGSGADRRD